MNARFRMGMLCAALAAAEPGVAVAEDPLDVDSFMRPCWAAKEENECKAMAQDFRKDWRKALRGDYQSQRNVAFCLRTSCSGAVEQNQILSCAWRAVVLTSGSLKVNELDVDAFEYDCRQLSDGGKLAAQRQAEYIIQRINR